jgi:tetratricopeptide (TPR) repeat protein
MARKQRRLAQVAAAAVEPKDKVRYEDQFQNKIGHRVEEMGKRFDGKGRSILYGIAALVILAALFGIFYQYSRRSSGAAQAALGKAIDITKTRISDAPLPAGSTEKTYKTEKERAEAAIAAFQDVVDKFGGAEAEKAKYFIAVNKLTVDRASGIGELEGIAKGSSEVSKMSKFALAQTKLDDGKFDEAAALYKELVDMPDSIIAKDTINLQLARTYEKQGKTKEAADIYYIVAKSASEAKDADGKELPLSDTGQAAKDKLTVLDPARGAEIQGAKEVTPNQSGVINM